MLFERAHIRLEPSALRCDKERWSSDGKDVWYVEVLNTRYMDIKKLHYKNSCGSNSFLCTGTSGLGNHNISRLISLLNLLSRGCQDDLDVARMSLVRVDYSKQ